MHTKGPSCCQSWVHSRVERTEQALLHRAPCVWGKADCILQGFRGALSPWVFFLAVLLYISMVLALPHCLFLYLYSQVPHLLDLNTYSLSHPKLKTTWPDLNSSLFDLASSCPPPTTLWGWPRRKTSTIHTAPTARNKWSLLDISLSLTDLSLPFPSKYN